MMKSVKKDQMREGVVTDMLAVYVAGLELTKILAEGDDQNTTIKHSASSFAPFTQSIHQTNTPSQFT